VKKSVANVSTNESDGFPIPKQCHCVSNPLSLAVTLIIES